MVNSINSSLNNRRNNLFILAFLSVIMVIIFMISSIIKPYGFFIDELYFMACSKRLAWGYVDQPPLSIALLWMMQHLFGNSIFVIRILPALSIAATVFITGLIARRLGGGLVSMLLSGLAVMIMPVFLVFGSFYSMNCFEPLIWTTIVFFVIKMIQEDHPHYWIQIGNLMGLGLEMKHTMALYIAALLIGFLFSDKRRLLFNRWILWGGLACFIIILPNLIWQVVNHFPSLELYRNSFGSKNINKSYLQVLIEQIIFANPLSFPLWFTGLVILAFTPGRKYRLLLYAYIFLLLVMMAGHSSRPDRISAIYTFFMASGAVAIEQHLKPFWRKFTQASIAILMVSGGVLLAPVFCPLLPPSVTKNHISRLGLHLDLEEGKKGEPIPQWLADRIGWPEFAEQVSQVYHALPANERQNAVIISSNYGTAGALEYYGPGLGLPKVYATHNSYHSWGPPSDTVHVYIGVFIDIDYARRNFESVEESVVFHCPDCTRPQRNVPIYILRGPKFSMGKEWKNFKFYH